MCIYDIPPSHCGERCGHLHYSRPLDDIISSMRELPPLPQEPIRDLQSVTAFQSFVSLHASLLAEIHGQVRGIRSNLCSLSTDISNVHFASQPPASEEEARDTEAMEVLDSEALLRTLNPCTSFTHALRLFSDFRSPVYKNKPFSLELKAIDSSRTPLQIISPLVFDVRIYKATLPVEGISEIETAEGRAGGPFLTGQVRVCVEQGDVILFRDLQFSDVTSNYPENWVFLVVRCVDDLAIKPLILEGVRIKARKPIVAECCS